MCFFPAGHLLLYKHFYDLYIQTEEGEQLLKMIHFVVHSIANMFVSLTAYGYFRDSPNNAQFISFLMVANHGIRRQESMMYND